MIRWAGRLFIVLALAAAILGLVAFTSFPDVIFRKASAAVQTYRSGITGPLAVANRGDWLPVVKGVESRTVEVTRGGRHPLSLYALRFHTSRIAIKVIAVPPKEITATPISTLVEKTRAVAMINGSYFNEGLGVLGLCLSGGKIISPLAKYSDNLGVFLVRENGLPELIHRDKFNAAGVTAAIQSGPWLVYDGKVQEFGELDRVTRRMCIGLDKKGRVIVVATDTTFSGITLANLAHLMGTPYEQGGFACVNALNLDGGTSTQLVLSTPNETHKISGLLNVPVLIGFYEK